VFVLLVQGWLDGWCAERTNHPTTPAPAIQTLQKVLVIKQERLIKITDNDTLVTLYMINTLVIDNDNCKQTVLGLAIIP